MTLHGMGFVTDAKSGLMWVNDASTGVVSPSDEEHDGRLALLVEGEAITTDQKIEIQLIFGNPNVMGNAGMQLLGALLTEENIQKTVKFITGLVAEQAENGELPHLIEEFKYQLFTPEEIEQISDNFYVSKRGEE